MSMFAPQFENDGQYDELFIITISPTLNPPLVYGL